MIGIFGGTGFYDFVEAGSERAVATPYGQPSAPPVVGRVGDIEVAFIPRHGRSHEFPPHSLPFRANLWSMQELGVERIIGPSAMGSLDMEFAPGDFVVCDQLVDFTYRRINSFVEGSPVGHLSFADPYCPELRELAIDACRQSGIPVHPTGTVVVVEGPRFSTRAESAFFAGQGWHVINMTQSTEASLARELEMCYVTIGVVTDYDVGVQGEIAPVTHAEVLERFSERIATLHDVLRTLIPEAVRTPRKCPCATARADWEG